VFCSTGRVNALLFSFLCSYLWSFLSFSRFVACLLIVYPCLVFYNFCTHRHFSPNSPVVTYLESIGAPEEEDQGQGQSFVSYRIPWIL
jgi:hypothetical protein